MKPTLGDNLAYIRDSRYARRVVAMLLVSTITLTLADYVFKSRIASLVRPEDLGRFLGTLGQGRYVPRASPRRPDLP